MTGDVAAAHARGVTAGLDRAGFVARFGGVVEHSPWVAEAVFEAGPFDDVPALHAAFTRVLAAAPPDRQLEVLCAHPDLAVRERAAQQLTEESAREQAGAGLDRLADDDRLALAVALTAYRDRFGFPFIVCVRDHGGTGLLDLARERVGRSPDEERATALEEVGAIVRHRLVDLLAGGVA